MTSRRKLIFQAGLAALLAWQPLAGFAETYPARPVRVVVPFPAGGVVDGLARNMIPAVSASMGQTIVIDNKGGAGGTMGTNEVARAAPDGYTMLMVFDSHAVNPFIYKSLPYGPKDLVAVSRLIQNPLVLLAHPSVSANSVNELVALGKQDPGGLSYATVGPGSSNHLTAELFASQAGIVMTHVPYRGGGPAQTYLLGGQVKLMFLSSSLAIPHLRAGKLKALAVTSAQRSAALPDVPTLAESGFPGFNVSSWVGMLAPAGTPTAVLERWRTEADKALRSPALQARFAEQGVEVINSPSADFEQFLQREGETWSKLIREKNIAVN